MALIQKWVRGIADVSIDHPSHQVDIPERPLPHNLSQADLFAEKQKKANKDSIMKRLYPGTEGMLPRVD